MTSVSSETAMEVKVNEMSSSIPEELTIEKENNDCNEQLEENFSESERDKLDPPNADSAVQSNGEKTCNVADEEGTSDEYHYLKRGEFSSEMFKVLVKNIPKKVTYGCFREGMKSALGFKPKKVKYEVSRSYAFLGFSNEKEREEALTKLNDKVWKGARLTCVKAAPAKDPFIQNLKRKQKFQGDGFKKQKISDENDSRPPEERIVDAVCPYASKPYEEQLSLKEKDMNSCIDKLSYKIWESIGKPKSTEGEFCLDLLPIIRSPVLNGYRNKVEFGIGKGSDKVDNIVGFRLSSYKHGCLSIAEPTNCINVPPKAINIAKSFQLFIQSLPYPSYNAVTHTGFWQQLTIRTFTTDDTMAIVQVYPSYLSEEIFESVEQKIMEHFASAEQSVKVSSIYISSSTQGNNCIDTYKHLAGDSHITEKLLGLQFRISPQAFFQVNTACAEVLYKTIREWCDIGQDDTCVLDVCCGTGTIGICVANDTSHKVIGIEMIQQAVEDARYNAEINGIKNATFICGQVEDVIHSTMTDITSDNIVAILDPPRAGLRRCVAETIRACSAIKKIIYVSCSPKQAIDNFVWLCRPESKRFRGLPFKTVRAVPVDLFPHSRHCELIIELVRTAEEVPSEPNNASDG